MNTKDRLYSAYVRLEKVIKHIVKAENFDEAYKKLQTEYPNADILSIVLEENLTLI